jgi:DNA mismatch repair protein MutS2
MNAREQVEAAIQEVRDSTAEKLDEAARAARRRVEEAADYQRRRRPDRRPAGRAASADGPETVSVGQRVRLPGASGSAGEVVELRDGRATVLVGGLKVEVPTADLTPVGGGGAGPNEGGKARPAKGQQRSGRPAGADRGRPEPRERGWSGPMPEARHEIDLRGRRVDEVDLELGRALDAAIIADLPEVRIIHGKGTGAVMSRVREVLAGDARVCEFRVGERGEGGSGVTVARLEDGA